MSDFAQTIPILPSHDLARTKKFYENQLGFTPTLFEAANYLIVRRDRMELHFTYLTDPELSKVTATYLRGGQIEDLYTEYRDREVPGLSKLLIRPWNMLEFNIHDPHGVLLRFGMAPEEAKGEWPHGHPG